MISIFDNVAYALSYHHNPLLAVVAGTGTGIRESIITMCIFLLKAAFLLADLSAIWTFSNLRYSAGKIDGALQSVGIKQPIYIFNHRLWFTGFILIHLFLLLVFR